MSISKLTENNPYTYPYPLRSDADISNFYPQPPDTDRRTLPDVYWTKGQLSSKFELPLSPPYGIKPSRLSKDYHITFQIWNWSWDPMEFLEECLWTPCLRAELYLRSRSRSRGVPSISERISSAKLTEVLATASYRVTRVFLSVCRQVGVLERAA